MAFPKKGLRKITVDGVKYGYHVTGNDGFISIAIELFGTAGEILTCYLDYHATMTTNYREDGTIRSWSAFQRTTITPDTIRQIIVLGLQDGWNPNLNRGQKHLGSIDDKINLKLKTAPSSPELQPAGMPDNDVD
jgi:hypothetical protein